MFRVFKRFFATAKPSRAPNKGNNATSAALYNGSPHPNYEVWVGLETHAQILSKTKLFSGASTSFLAPPNTRAAFFDAALPGTLPRINMKCVEQAIRTGLALGGLVANECRFDRKHYFYCDMPLGYQVTQQEYPLVKGGEVAISDLIATDSKDNSQQPRKVRIARIQLEQDSGKTLHDARPGFSYVDLNRAGCALMEIVTEPDIRSAEEATAYMRKLQALLRQIGASTGNMEDGSLRCDVNVTVRRISPPGQMTQRVEIKNLNSLRSIARAIEYEARRQIELLESGGQVERETRTFNAKTGETSRLRSKEELLDYRFLPEPDLPTLKVSPEWVESIAKTMPELPDVLYDRFTKEFGLTKSEASFLVYEPGAATYFMQLTGYTPKNEEIQGDAVSVPTTKRPPKVCAGWFISELIGRINKLRVLQQQQAAAAAAAAAESDPTSQTTQDSLLTDVGLTALAMNWGNVQSERLGELIDLVLEASISGKQAKEVLDVMVLEQDARSPREIATERNMVLDSDPVRIRGLCRAIVDLYPDEVQEYVTKGRQQFFGFLVGQAIKLSKQDHLHQNLQTTGQDGQPTEGAPKPRGEANPKQVAIQMRLELQERGLLKD